MSRNTRWKLEKTKVKVVFRLQFHATHIPQTGWNNLFISFIPSDAGKATAKTNKANVRNGTCKWADPIYESTRLLQDSKTKQYEEKLYKLLVAMGTSRSSLLGEANINLADYVDASKPMFVALPLHGSDSGAILHVTLQLLTSKTGFREFEQQREVSDRGVPANTDHEGGRLSALGEAVVSRADKVNPRVRFKPEPKDLPSPEVEPRFSEDYTDSAVGLDGSSNTSGSLYAEKQDYSSTREIDSVKSTISGDLGAFSPSQSPTMDKGKSDHHFPVHGTSDWVHQWGAENSVDRDMAIVYEENSRLRGALEAADISIHELRQEVVSLQNFANSLNVEAHKWTEQIAVEISSEQKLAKEVCILKSECLRFQHDLEWVRNLKMNPPIPGRKLRDADQGTILQDMSLGWLKGLKDLEDKIFQLQNKVYHVADGKDLLFLQSDLEELCSVVIDLKRGTERSIYQLGEMPDGKSDTIISEMNSIKSDHAMSDTGLGVELCHPEGLLFSGLLPSGTSSVDANNAMQAEIFKLLRELDESKTERENLVGKMDQMECYYEALIQELEENQKQILGELQNLRHEHASCMYTVSSNKAQMEAMHQQMNNELLQFAEERCSLDALNKELERRAATSEAALRRARMNYSIAVNQLQKDLEVLSLQVLSMHETNDNLIRKALPEPSQAFVQSFEEADRAVHVAEGSKVDKIMESPSGNVLNNNHLGADILLEDLKSSLALQKDLYRKMLDELSDMHLENLNLDIFSVVVHHALLQSDLDSRREMHELAEQLELSFKINESLRLKLHNLSDEICTLNEEKSNSVSRSNDLVLENQTLQAKLKNVGDEKYSLSEKIGELESLVAEYRAYKSNYEICDPENAKLVNQLENIATDKHHLSNEVFLLQEQVMTMKIKVSESEKLQEELTFIRERLENLMAICNELANGLLPHCKEDQNTETEEITSIIMCLEEHMLHLCNKILKLMEEKKNLLNEQVVARASFASAESQVKVVKRKFEQDVSDTVLKLNASSVLVEKLQTDFEAVSNKLQISSEVEEKCTQMTRDLLSDFVKMEAALQELTRENRDIADKIMAFGSVTDELEGNKLIVNELKQENLSLTGSLQLKINECDMLTKELDSLKGTVESLQDEINLLRGIREQLDAQILNLNNQLNEGDQKLAQIDQQESELNHLKQQLSDAESEKLSLHHRLSYADSQVKKALLENSSTISESQLLEMHELLIAADVVRSVVVKQYELHVEELLWQLELFHQNVVDVDKENIDLASRLSNCLAGKENLAAENASLLSEVKSLTSNLEYNLALNQALEQSNSSLAAELNVCENKSGLLQASCADNENTKCEIAELKCLLRTAQDEIESLILSKELLEIKFLVLETTIGEMSADIISHGRCKEDQAMMKKQCGELTRKLSEQILKTEEFKNLSIHLKELKDKADADYLQAHEKRETEGLSSSSQDSLRIAFIKEQYETKLQELCHQLKISKKHGEEMLWKLQDALDELESRKKYDASQLKRNEELQLKITELEAELQLVLSETSEKFMSYEQLRAELDCSVMSLDCCKEEKNQLTISLQECNDYIRKLTDEVTVLREKLGNLKTSTRRAESNDGCHVLFNDQDMVSAAGNIVENSHPSTSSCRGEALEEGPMFNSSHHRANPQTAQEGLVTEATTELAEVRNSENDAKPNGDLVNVQLKPQFLLSSIERLHKELEQMRSENGPLPEDGNPDQPMGESLQRDQVHLEKVSEELETMSSLYNDSSRSGNSVERVLALELELAEALQSKKKSSIQFQSSFLKLHSDEAAVFQSFRDINELIKDMLEMKERYSGMETEQKEMHERYSQLSLDFAEVEGERQKLTMMLKNVRPSKRLLSRSPTSSHEELSP